MGSSSVKHLSLKREQNQPRRMDFSWGALEAPAPAPASGKLLPKAPQRDDDTNANHALRCELPSLDCTRCKYIRNKAKWARIAQVPGLARTWLNAKSAGAGGKWGVGCTVCELAGGSSSFATYAVQSTTQLQKCNLLAHGRNATHKRAIAKLLGKPAPETGC